MHLLSWIPGFKLSCRNWTGYRIVFFFFYRLCSVPLTSAGKWIFALHSIEFIFFLGAVMKLNHNVTENKHVALLCSFVISQMGQGVPLVVVVLQCCMMFAGVTRTARMSLWATGEGKTKITCTGSTCPACTAVAAATAARPPSLLRPTPSATHLSLSTCKYFTLLWIWIENCTKWKAQVVDNLFSQSSRGALLSVAEIRNLMYSGASFYVPTEELSPPIKK